MSDRLQEIRARLDRFRPDMPWVTVGEGSPAWDGAKWQELFLHAPDDLRWLLREVEKWKHVAENDLYGACWCDAPRPDCCECPGARGDAHRGESA